MDSKAKYLFPECRARPLLLPCSACLQMIKYGVIGTQMLYDDLQYWDTLYIAGGQHQDWHSALGLACLIWTASFLRSIGLCWHTVSQWLHIDDDLKSASIQLEACCASLTWGTPGPQQRCCLSVAACRRPLELAPHPGMQPACLQGVCRSQS